MTSLRKDGSVAKVRIRQEHNTHIAFLLTHGFAARTVIRSGLARWLATQQVRVTVISPNANETYFQEECERETITLQQEPKSGGRIAQLFRTYRPYFLDDVLNN